MKIVHNVETNEIIETEMTAEEIKLVEKMNIKVKERRVQAGEKLKAQNERKEEVLTRLGLTSEEIALFLN